MSKNVNIALILAGCGHLDGAEIREVPLALLALDQHGANVPGIAPNAPFFHVINHDTGEPVTNEARNRPKEANLDERNLLFINHYLGVTKNPCCFFSKRAAAELRPDIEAFLESGRPVGAVGIAPALVARCLAKAGKMARLPLGDGGDIKASMEKLGQPFESVPSARDIAIDKTLKLVTTPTFLFADTRLSDVWVGIERCVTEVLRRSKQRVDAGASPRSQSPPHRKAAKASGYSRISCS